MTRRIAITILFTVWTAILVAGMTAWLTARVVLLQRLDATTLHRALVVAAQNGGAVSVAPALESDRYLIRTAHGKTVVRQPYSTLPAMQPQVLDAAFVTLPEGRFRRLTVQVNFADQQPLTLVYSTPCAAYDQVLHRLALALGGCGIAAGALAATMCAWLARLSLRPLQAACTAMNQVNDANLTTRMDVAALPVELRPMAGHFNQMIGRLQQAFEQRRRFLADASHELRTPVAAMITTMEVAMKRPRSAEELTETLQTCLTEACHMRALVQALLAQIKAQGADPAQMVERFDIGKIVDDCTKLGQSLALEKQVAVSGKTEGTLSTQGDPNRLRSALLNLISNGIDYNHAGGRVDVRAMSDGNQWVKIFVEDNGPGIASKHLPNLFQPFYRASNGGSSNGHLGLGLFLVQADVKALGGTCDVASTVGQGTIFQIRLPAQPSSDSNKNG